MEEVLLRILPRLQLLSYFEEWIGFFFRPCAKGCAFTLTHAAADDADDANAAAAATAAFKAKDVSAITTHSYHEPSPSLDTVFMPLATKDV